MAAGFFHGLERHAQHRRRGQVRELLAAEQHAERAPLLRRELQPADGAWTHARQPRQRHAARWQLDAEAELRLSPRFSLAVGGYNLTDRYPTRSRSDIDYGGNFPYDVISPIGINGRYVYARVRYSFGSGGVEG